MSFQAKDRKEQERPLLKAPGEVSFVGVGELLQNVTLFLITETLGCLFFYLQECLAQRQDKKF